jgi:hypothetical protein
LTTSWRRVSAGLLALVVAIGVLAASTSDAAAHGDRAGGVSSQPSVVRGVTPTSIEVEGLGTVALFAGADVGAKARFQRANATGGVFGRTFDYRGFKDDQGVGATNQQVGTSMVRQDQVFAAVPVVTTDLGAVDSFVDLKVPYFGWALSSNFCGNRYGFGFSGCLFPPGRRITSNAWGTLVETALGAQVPSPTAVVLTESTPAGQSELASLTSNVSSAGIDVVLAQSSLPVPPADNYDALGATILAANGGKAPDAVFVVASYSTVVLLQRTLRIAGFGGIFTDTNEYDPDLVSSATSTSVLLQTAPIEAAANNTAMQQLVTDVRAVDPSIPIDQGVVAGYVAADMFVAAVRRAGKDLTLERFLDRANKGFTYELDGAVGPTTFPADHNAPTPCGSLVRSDGGAYQVVVPYSCGRVVKVKR